MRSITKKAIYIVQKLVSKGFKAYFAGGCVRDTMLVKKYNDIDIATDALPRDIMKLFRYTIPVGAKFGVVIVVIDNIRFEIATFRKDGAYIDGRRPASVSFASEKEDVERRDFTINGMLYDPINDKIIDFVGGEADIKAGIIKCIGEPFTRFNEDKLRLMRAVRFASVLSYQIEENTWNALTSLANKIDVVSKERIRDELFKILLDKNAHNGVKLLIKSGLLKEILPELFNMRDKSLVHKENSELDYTIRVIKNIKKNSAVLAFSALLHNITGKSFNKDDKLVINICKGLKLSNKEQATVNTIILSYNKTHIIKSMSISTLKRFIRQSSFELILDLYKAHCMAANKDLINYNFAKDKLKQYPKRMLAPKKIIDGDALIEMGLRPGPGFQNIINSVENAQLEGKITTKKEAIKYIKTYLMKG